MRHVMMVAAVVLAMPAAASAQAMAPQGPAVAGQVALTAAEYVDAAAAADLFERVSSEMVLRDEDGSAEVRGFAQRMVTDHQNLSVMRRELAQGLGVQPGVPAMTPVQQAKISQLQAATGVERERVYLIQQAEAHREALALHQGYAMAGEVPALRDHARMAAQIVEGHMMELQRVRQGR